MNKEIRNLNQILVDSWNNFLESVPAIILAIVVAFVGLYLIRKLGKLAFKLIDKKSKDPLVSDFLVNIISFVLTILLIVICLSILGLGNITNKILAGAGIGTLVLGFALKDIGENFLAGIIMAFNRPFRVGDLIEIEGIKGKVMQMSLRETNIKTLDGRDVFIPNGSIIKNPLQNFTLDNYLRNEFLIGLDYDDNADEIMILIEEIVKGFDDVEKHPAPSVYIEELASSTVNVRVQYWVNAQGTKVPASNLRSNMMLKVYKTILEKGYKLPSDIVEVKIIENTSA